MVGGTVIPTAAACLTNQFKSIFMSDILYDTLVGAVDNLEKKTDKIQEKVNGLPDPSELLKAIDTRLGAAEKDIKEMPAKIFMPLPEIKALTETLQYHSRLLKTPLKQEIRHEHHITKPIIACISLSLVVIGLLFLEYYTWLPADRNKQNDIKYRYLQVFEGSEGQRSLHNVDSMYNANPDDFRKLVIQQEKIEQERFEDFKRMQENEEQNKHLQEKWKQQPSGRHN
jgi:hypothetical protein